MHTLLLLVVCVVPCVFGHGYLEYPPARNSMWRLGFDSPINYNDNELNCGGASNQWDNNEGECGLCGDPWQAAQPRRHEAGGSNAPTNRHIGRCYNKNDSTIEARVRITAYHKGYFQFFLCVNNDMKSDPDQSCFDNGRLLEVAGYPGLTKYDINSVKQEFYDFQLTLPKDVECTQCIIRWVYTAGNNWGCDDTGCGHGLGNQEQFINCADIAILEDCGDESFTTEGPTVSPTDSTSDTLTDDPTVETTVDPTDEPTTRSTGAVCRAVGQWENLNYMDGWCTFHCSNPTIVFCPPDHCACS